MEVLRTWTGDVGGEEVGFYKIGGGVEIVDHAGGSSLILSPPFDAGPFRSLRYFDVSN